MLERVSSALQVNVVDNSRAGHLSQAIQSQEARPPSQGRGSKETEKRKLAISSFSCAAAYDVRSQKRGDNRSTCTPGCCMACSMDHPGRDLFEPSDRQVKLQVAIGLKVVHRLSKILNEQTLHRGAKKPSLQGQTTGPSHRR